MYQGNSLPYFICAIANWESSYSKSSIDVLKLFEEVFNPNVNDI